MLKNRYTLSDDEYKKVLRLGFVERGGKDIPSVEAVFLNQIGVINIANDVLDTLKNSDKYMDEKLRIMDKLLKKGYITRTGMNTEKPDKKDEEYMRIYRKGMRVGEDRTRWILRIVKSANEITGDVIYDVINRARQLRKKGVICIVDKDITFISVSKSTFE